MQRVSSNLTIFFKLFIPTVWGVFFSIFTLTLFIIDENTLPFLTSPIFKYPFLAAFLFFLTLVYFTLLQLKRVEMGPEYYIVSNYFKTFRLIYEDIVRIDIIPIGPLQVVTFRLRAKGSFGKKITFLASKNLYESFLQEHPEVAKFLDNLKKEG